jgi:Family of unknown function (DUF6157)
MHTTNYIDTLITLSPDSKTVKSKVPDKEGSVAAETWRMISAAPYALTSDDVIFGVFAMRKGIPADEQVKARAVFFSKGQACLRASPLVKQYGWGVHHDAKGRVALIAAESPEYAALSASHRLTRVPGMRSSRA